MAIINEHVFDGTGRLWRRRIEQHEIQVTPEMAAQLVSDVTFNFRAVARHEMGMINACFNNALGHTFWTVKLKKLHLRTTYRVAKDLVTPSFESSDDPQLAIDWYPIEGMTLAFLMRCTDKGTSIVADTCYLFAMSQDKNVWHLPIGNLHDDCKVCMGQEAFVGYDYLEVIDSALQQLKNSNWNIDLWKDKANCMRMFRFAPSDIEGFHQLPINAPDNDWTRLCVKVGSNLAKFIVV